MAGTLIVPLATGKVGQCAQQRLPVAAGRCQFTKPERQPGVLISTRAAQPPLQATANLAERVSSQEEASSARLEVPLREPQTDSPVDSTTPIVNGNASESSSSTSRKSTQEPEQNHHRRTNGLRTQGRSSNHERVEQYSFKLGDYVLGKVIREDPQKGWRVELLADPGIIGLMPSSFKPYTIRDDLEDFQMPSGAIGTVRMFRVDRIPEEIFYNGKGPVLSAGAWDHQVIWRRAEQIRDLHAERTDTLRVKFRSWNKAGLLGVWDSIPLFVPWMFVRSADERALHGGKEDPEETAQRELAKNSTYVSVVDVDPAKRRFIGNLVQARQIRALEGVQIGELMTGVIVKVVSYGCFLRMGNEDNTDIKGLLHIRNVTQGRCSNLEDVFRVGDKVSAFLIDVDEKNQVEFSTMELESYPGEMLEDPDGCMEDGRSRGCFQDLHEKAVQAKTQRRQQGEGRPYGRGGYSQNNNGNDYGRFSDRDFVSSSPDRGRIGSPGEADLDW